MWGVGNGSVQSGLRVQSLSMTLLRDKARVSVTMSDPLLSDPGHSLASVMVFNATDKFSLMPLIDQDANAVTPSIPAEATIKEGDAPAAAEAASKRSLVTIDIPEQNVLMGSLDGNPSDDNVFKRPAVIVGMYWKGSSTLYYYRLDFVENGELVDVERNHWYRFNVKAVNGPGSDTPEEAYYTKSTAIEAEVVDWRDINNDVALDGSNWIAMSREITLGPSVGDKGSLSFKTNVSPYLWEMAWGLPDGDYDSLEFSEVSGLEDSSLRCEDFEVTVAGEGENGVLSFKALTQLPDDLELRTMQLYVNVTPRLRLVVNVSQTRGDGTGSNGDNWDDQDIYLDF